jgi:hypothetical protein
MKLTEKPEIVAINWEGFEAHTAGLSYAANPYFGDLFKRALWGKGWVDGKSGRLAPETDYGNTYWIVDDCLDESREEGFQIFHGCPFRALGVKQGEYRTYGAALASIPADEVVFRVKLARRHGQHSVTRIGRAGGPGIEGKKARAAIVQDADKAFDKARITWEADLITELEIAGGMTTSDAISLLEVKLGKVDEMYIENVTAAAAAQTLLNAWK